MPTYEYRCKDCGENLEVVQAFSDEALTDCPYCHGSLRKVFNSVGISFKGSGFYKNDSRPSPTKSSSTSSTSSSDGSSSSTSSDSSSSTSSGGDSSSTSGSTSGSDSSSSSTKAQAASA